MNQNQPSHILDLLKRPPDARALIGSRFQHWKGGVYVLLAIAEHSESHEIEVVYQSEQDGRVWVRPHAMFFGDIRTGGDPGYFLPRFTLIAKQRAGHEHVDAEPETDPEAGS